MWVASGMCAGSNRTQSWVVVVKTEAMNIGNDGLYDLLFYCWINLGIGGDEGLEITTQDGRRPGGDISRLGCPGFHLVHVLW